MYIFLCRIVLLVSFSISLLPTTIFSQAIVKKDFSGLEKALVAELAAKKGVGATVAIVSGTGILYAKGFGAANGETGASVTPDTLFQTGSVTKPFTAALVLSMVAEGRLKLDAPVSNYAKGLSPFLGQVNLGQLLSHTSGILDEPDEFGPQDEGLMAPYIRSWKDDYVLFPAGEVFSYSNSGYALAGFTASESAGKPFTALMEEKIFGPLGMKSTTFHPTTAMTRPLAVGHQIREGKPVVVRPLPNDARLYPAGTMYTSINDLARFAIAFLNDGKIDGKEVISPQTIAAMSAPRARQMSEFSKLEYGYGMFIESRQNVIRVWHEGGMTGYTASILFVPEQKFAVVIMSNTDNVVLRDTQAAAVDAMLKPGMQIDGSGDRPEALKPGQMVEYAGKYTQPKRFDIEVFIKDGQLFIREFGLEMPLTYYGGNRFKFQLPRAPRPLEIYIQPQTTRKTGFLHQYVWAFKKVT